MQDLEEPVKDPVTERQEENADQLKLWLFKENIRMEALRKELEEKEDRLYADRERFSREMQYFNEDMKVLSSRIEGDRKRLVQDNRFFEQKMRILQDGFSKLDADRRKIRKEKERLEAAQFKQQDNPISFGADTASMLFCGVNSFLTLKKRYKDLIKMFHPDNVAGDHEMIQIVNREYEELRKAYMIGKDIGKQA